MSTQNPPNQDSPQGVPTEAITLAAPEWLQPIRLPADQYAAFSESMNESLTKLVEKHGGDAVDYQNDLFAR